MSPLEGWYLSARLKFWAPVISDVVNLQKYVGKLRLGDPQLFQRTTTLVGFISARFSVKTLKMLVLCACFYQVCDVHRVYLPPCTVCHSQSLCSVVRVGCWSYSRHVAYRLLQNSVVYIVSVCCAAVLVGRITRLACPSVRSSVSPNSKRA